MADDKNGIFSKVKQLAKKVMEDELKLSVLGMIREKFLEFKRSFIKSVAAIIFLAFGISMVFIGLSQYLAYVFPVLSQGIGLVLFGLVLVIVSLIIWIRK